MKYSLLGIAIILFGVAIMIAYSSTGYGYLLGTKIGLTISFIGLIINILSLFLRSDNSSQE